MTCGRMSYPVNGAWIITREKDLAKQVTCLVNNMDSVRCFIPDASFNFYTNPMKPYNIVSTI